MINDPIARGIEKIIQEKGIKKNYVAKRAGFTVAQFSNLLNGRKLIKAEDMPKIAYALDTTVPQIYEAGKAKEEE